MGAVNATCHKAHISDGQTGAACSGYAATEARQTVRRFLSVVEGSSVDPAYFVGNGNHPGRLILDW